MKLRLLTTRMPALRRKRLAGALLIGAAALVLPVAVAGAKPPPKPVVAALPPIQATDWVTVDPDNLLVIDTNHGRILAELYPVMAPATVERIKVLARQHFYDGQTFFRVIDQFMAQTGDPTNTGAGGSTLPNLPAEFTFRRDSDFPFVAVNQEPATVYGLSGPMPIASQPDALLSMSASGTVAAWGTFCPGVLGMARAEDPKSGNSQFYLIRQTSTSLDKKYTAFGRVLVGLDVVRQIKTGEPVKAPQDKMVRVRLASDLPPGETVKLARMKPDAALYLSMIEKEKDRKGPDFSVCDMDILINPNPA